MCLAVPGQIISITGENKLSRCGEVCFGGAVRQANLAFVPEAVEGDYVLVHAGIAITILCEDTAKQRLAEFKELP